MKSLSTLSLLFLIVLQVSCSGTGDSFNKILTDASSNPTEKDPCVIKSFSPAAKSLRWGVTGEALNFSVETVGVNCKVLYYLDDVEIPTEGALLTINQSTLSAGAHKVRLEVSNKVGTVKEEWALNPNNPPVCKTQIPAANSATQTSAGTPVVLTAAGQDADKDDLTYSWKFNGLLAPSSSFSVIDLGTASQAVYTPTGTHAGANNITVEISDGYDIARCSYNVQVSGACSIADSNPTTSSFRVAASSNTNTSFGVVPSSGTGCNVTWQLRGSDFASPGNFVTVNSGSHLVAGPNTLTARVTGGGGTFVEKRWTLTKNSPPVCSSSGLNAPTPNTNGYSLNYNTNVPISIGIDDSVDRDALSVSWLLNGQVSTSGTVIDSPQWNTTAPFSAYSGKASVTFRPQITNLGFNTIVARANDGYDTSDCMWNIQVLDPTGFNVLSCDSSAITQNAPNPNVAATSHNMVNALIKSEGGNRNSIITLSPLAVGSGITYRWTKDGVPTGTVGSSIVLDNSLAAGKYVYRVEMTDAFNSSTQFCEWRVKRNTKPSINGTLPMMYSGQQRYYMNHLTALSLGVTAIDTDPDDNSLNYTWTVNGQPNSRLIATSGTANFMPAAEESLRGDIIIGVQASDGYEVASQSWNVRVNAFSTYCNEVYNSDPSINANKSKTCTLVGDPRVGLESNPLEDPFFARLRPRVVLEDPTAGNPGFFIVSEFPVGVYYWNRTAGPVTKLGIDCPPNQVTRLAGIFGHGTPPSQGAKVPDVKIGDSWGVEYDAANGYLYLADGTNHVVHQINSSGELSWFLGTGSTGQSAAVNTEGQLGADPTRPGIGAVCVTPRALKIQTVASVRWLYVACSGSHAIKRIGINPSDTTNYGKTQFVVGALSGGVTSVGIENGQAVNDPGVSPPGASPTYARASNPIGIDVDKNGVVYWTDQGSSMVAAARQSKLRVANLSGSPVKFFNDTLTVNHNQTADLVGKTFSETTAFNSVNIGVGLGRTKIYNTVTIQDPFTVNLDTAGGTLSKPRGAWLSTYGAVRPLYVNFDTNSYVVGNTTIPAGHVGSIAQDSGSYIDSTISSSYFSTISDVKSSNDGKYVWIVDFGNVRIRAINLSDSNPPAGYPAIGSVGTLYGGGLPRFGTTGGDIPSFVTSFFPYTPYGVAINPSQWKLYFAEQNAGRIRQVDLKNGVVETYAGRGIILTSPAIQDVLMGTGGAVYPKGLTLVPGAEPVVMWVESNISSSAPTNGPGVALNTACLVRAANGNSSDKNLMGTQLLPGKMSVVAGSFSAGCGSPLNTGTASSIRSRNPQNVYYNSFTNDTLLVDTNGHCIHKITSTGAASVFVGTCDSANTAGSSQPAETDPNGGTVTPLLRYPTAVVADPIEPNNYFIVDQFDNLGKVRYVNTTMTDQTINGTVVKSRMANALRVQKVWSETTNGNLNAIAAYKVSNTNAIICISSGGYANGIVGDHKIFCFNRDGSGSRTFGGNNRGASPQDFSEEGILGVNANFYNPAGLDFDEDGNLYVAERTGSLIRMIRRWF